MTRRRIPLRDLVARGPVLSARESAAFDEPAASGASLDGPPLVEVPVLPLQVFGVPYDLDLVVVDDHPDWDMHELARVRTPDGPVWLCKDSRARDLVQTIVADHAEVHTVLPEVPLARRRGRVVVDDTEAPRRVRVAYVNDDGEPVEVDLRAGSLARQCHRNASTMGHSGTQVLAVLDLSHRAFARATIRIGGVERKVERILGLVPFSVALAQTQAGFAKVDWTQVGATTHHGAVEQAWTVEPEADAVVLTQVHPWRTLRYRFLRRGADLELARAEVWAFGTEAPACVVAFQPSLPDLRRRLRRPWEGTFRLDVGGQAAHGTGAVRVSPVEGGALVEIAPTAPRWLADRRLEVTLAVGADGVVARSALRPASDG